MKKNKFLCVVLTLVMAVALLSGCGADNGSSTGASVQPETKKVSSGDLDVEILSCAFDKEIMGVDEESSTWGYTERDGRVYVNLALKIKNNTSEALSKDTIKGYFELNDLRHDLQCDFTSVVPVYDEANIMPGYVGIVNLFDVIEKKEMNNDITIHFSVKDKEFDEKVAPLDTRTAFEKKTKVSVGDKFNVNGLYDVEVISCEEKQYIQATNYAESEQYKAFGDDKIIDLLLKVKNNTDVNLEEIRGYAPVNGKFSWADVKIEVNNNTELKTLGSTTDEPLKPGQEEYIHVCAMIEKNESADNSAIRFNLGGNCYYCVIE